MLLQPMFAYINRRRVSLFTHVSVSYTHLDVYKRQVHVRAFRSTVMALAGHFLAQIPQTIQSSVRMPICPLVRSCHSLGTTGYMRVAGFLNKLFSTTFPILKVAITLTYLSVQLIQGSIVKIKIGTSARSQPCSLSLIHI